MRFANTVGLVCAVGFATSAFAAPAGQTTLQQQVADTERAFAATMKARDHAAFVRFLSDDTLFYDGKNQPLHGKDVVAKEWQRFYQGPVPFAWEPDEVEVMADGKLAYSTGPVYDPAGKLIARYNSIWRLEAPGTWRIVFDKGQALCDCKKP